MRGKAHILWKRITVGVLIMIMGIILVNKSVYTHVHVLPDGSMTVHAHPFSKNAENNKGNCHQHSNLEFFLLDMMDVLFLSSIAVCTLKLFAQTAQFRTPAKASLFPSLVPISPGRAPPTCM